MVHPAIRKRVSAPLPPSWTSSVVTISPSPSNNDDRKSAISAQQSHAEPPATPPSNAFRDLSTSTSAVHDIHSSLCTLVDMMTSSEFAQILRSRIKHLLANWPPTSHGASNSHPANLSSTDPSLPAKFTTESVVGLVTFFRPEATRHSSSHDPARTSLPVLLSQLRQLQTFLSFLSVPELVQVFRSRLEAQKGTAGQPNVLQSVLDVLRSDVEADGESGLSLAISRGASSELDAARGVSEVSSYASQTDGKSIDEGAERPSKRVKVDTFSESDDDDYDESLYSPDAGSSNPSPTIVASPAASHVSMRVEAPADASTVPPPKETSKDRPSNPLLSQKAPMHSTRPLVPKKEPQEKEPAARKKSPPAPKADRGPTGAPSNMFKQSKSGHSESPCTDQSSASSVRTADSTSDDDDMDLSDDGEKLLVSTINGQPQPRRLTSQSQSRTTTPVTGPKPSTLATQTQTSRPSPGYTALESNAEGVLRFRVVKERPPTASKAPTPSPVPASTTPPAPAPSVRTWQPIYPPAPFWPYSPFHATHNINSFPPVYSHVPNANLPYVLSSNHNRHIAPAPDCAPRHPDRMVRRT